MTRRGLGRGLDALLTGTEGEPSGLRDVPIDSIEPNPYQPRHSIDETELEDLTASIRVHGLIQPLVVSAADGGYQLIVGERRWRAAQAAGLNRVPVVVRTASRREMLALAIIENVQRTDLDPIESAEAYRQLMVEFDLTQSEVAEMVGKSRVAIANTIRLLGLSDDVRHLVSAGHLSEGHARALLAIEDGTQQLEMAQRVIAGGWTVRRAEHEVRSLAKRGAPRPERHVQPSPDPDTAFAARELEGSLGTRVEIRRRGEGGQIVIHFYSEEELAALYDRLLGSL